MGTKNNPGAFDCYANAEPDEPMFVLLGRDGHAPALVLRWAEERERDGEDPEKVAEARACAVAMVQYRNKRKPSPNVTVTECPYCGKDVYETPQGTYHDIDCGGPEHATTEVHTYPSEEEDAAVRAEIERRRGEHAITETTQ